MSGEDGRVDLADFLLARIAEDEAAARSLPPFIISAVVADERIHFARWVPARVLAECDAKRRIVNEHPIYHDGSTQHDCPGWWNGYIDEPGTSCPTLRLLALPYADHPDYDEAWRP